MAGTASHLPLGLIAAPSRMPFPRSSTANRRREAVDQTIDPVPSEVGVTSLLPSGENTAASSPESTPWSNPKSNGLVCSPSSNAPLVSSVSSSSNAATASKSPRSGWRSTTLRETAATRAMSARSRESAASCCLTRANAPAPSATTSATLTAPTRIRSRRTLRALARSTRSDSARLASAKSRSEAESVGSVCSQSSSARDGGRCRARWDPAQLLPGRGGSGQMPADREGLALVVDPSPQPGPFADQRLVGKLDRALVERQQPCVGEGVHHRHGR